MPLSRHRRVGRVWSWLPAFRAVAEYESIQRAALALSVSPSSLSRTMKLLEADLGYAVFTRSPTGTLLTPSGQRLLEGTRDAMRRVDEALPAVSNRLTIGIEGELVASVVARAIASSVSTAVTLQTHAANALADQLRRGDLDFAVFWSDLENPSGLELTLLAETPWVAVGASSSELVSLENHWSAKSAKCIATSLESAIVLAKGLGLGLIIPQVFAPLEMPVRKTFASVFRIWVAHRTAVVPNQSAHLTALTEVLRASLRHVGVDEVV